MSLSRPSAEKHEKNEKNPTGRCSPYWDRPNMSDLRIVLLGKNLFENIRVRNFILGPNVKETKLPSDYLKKHSVRISEMVLENRNISLIRCSSLLQLNLTQHLITERVRECVNESDPGPHVFMLILQHQEFSEKDKHRVMHVLKCFSDQAMKRTIVLTTDEETQRSKHSSVRNNALNQLINECGGGHLYFNERQSGWRSEMIKRVDDILEKEPEEYLKCDIYEDAEAEGSAEEYSSHKKNKDGGGLFSSISEKSNLNLVLCGADPGLKVNISKLLRGKPPSNKKEFSPQCVKKEEKIHGHQISVVELPSLTQLSEDEVRLQTHRCVSLCDPGVHVFLLIVPVGPLTDEDKAEVQKIKKMFYSTNNFMVIFTSDLTVDKKWKDSLESNPECQNLISLCGGRYRVIGLKEHEQSKQIPDLLDYIKDMKTEPYQEMRERDETKEEYKEKQLKINSSGIEEEEEDLKHLRIVLIGKTGSGKSATGNTILGRNEFLSQSSTDSVTTVCEKRVGEVYGRSVAVVDTPGLFETKTQKEQVVEEIIKCVSLSSPGPHAFIIVLSVGRFTREELDTIDQMKIFGPKAAQFSIVLFTRGDDLEDLSIEDYVNSSTCEELNKLIRDCGDRYLSFNNRDKQDRTQVTKLIKMIEEMKTTNQGRYFTNIMFEEAEMSIKKKKEELLKEKEREIQAEKEEIKVKHEIEMENMMKRLEEEKRKADEERVQMENKLREQEETLRKEFEEKEKTERQKQEKEKQKRLEEEKQQQRAEYDQKIEEMKREIEQQISQREKEKEEEDRKREEKYRQDQEKLKAKEDLIIQLQKKQEEENKKKDLDEQKRREQEEREKQEWVRKIKEAENDKKEIQEEIKRQQREWEEKNKRQMRKREEDEKERREKHEKELREKQKELKKTRKKFEKERDEERQKQRQEREEKEREYEEKKNEMMKYYEKLDRERKEEWERKRREDDERREEERKRWEKRNEDIKREKEEEMRRRERERKDREREKREEMKQEHEQRIKEMKKKHEDEARKQAEEFNEFREKNEKHVKELKQTLEEEQKQREELEKLHQQNC